MMSATKLAGPGVMWDRAMPVVLAAGAMNEQLSLRVLYIQMQQQERVSQEIQSFRGPNLN